MGSYKLFSDKWLRIVGIPLIGIAFPLLFGQRPGDRDFFLWIIISVVITFLSWVASRQFIIAIWNKFPWEKNPFIHIIADLAFIFFSALVIIVFVFIVNLVFFGSSSDYWESQKDIHFAIVIVIFITVTIHEAIFLFFLWKRALTRAADLEKEAVKAKFEALKNHINPHFLFNSLGTLNSLINTNPDKATQYVNEFSKIYRYFLEVNNQDIVTLREEIDFIYSYIFLQKIRHGEGFTFSNRIGRQYYKSFILPLTLQLLIENALKHNSTGPDSILNIEVFVADKGEELIVRNNLQPRKTGETPKIGLANLKKRYESFTGRPIRYMSDRQYFTVYIPIISQQE